MPRRRKRKGSQFEQVVEEVIRVMDPNAIVNRGQWVEGPDGYRELDINILGTYEGQERKILLECKDFNPTSTGPVGIGHVDALESKTRDLSYHFSAICSNAGFTEGAIRKASRVGIGLISIMKRGDKRIRFGVTEEIYTRKINIEELSISLEGPKSISLEGVNFNEILFDGMPVANWVTKRVLNVISSNPIVSGTYSDSCPFTQQLVFTVPIGSVNVTQLNSHLKISGGWFAHQVTLNTTQGFYDWLRHRVRMAPGPGQFFIEGINIYEGIPIDKPPEREIKYISQIDPGELVMKLVLVTGLEMQDPVPDLSNYIKMDDLNPIIQNIPPEAYTSSII